MMSDRSNEHLQDEEISVGIESYENYHLSEFLPGFGFLSMNCSSVYNIGNDSK